MPHEFGTVGIPVSRLRDHRAPPLQFASRRVAWRGRVSVTVALEHQHVSVLQQAAPRGARQLLPGRLVEGVVDRLRNGHHGRGAVPPHARGASWCVPPGCRVREGPHSA